MNQNQQNTQAMYSENDINWQELRAINIHKEELEKDGNLERLLNGEKTEVITLNLIMLGIDVVIDANLQLSSQNGSPIVEIIGLQPNQH